MTAPTPERDHVTSHCAGCRHLAKLIDDWGSGYNGTVTVTNSGSTPTTTWTVVAALNGSTISQVWSANSQVSGSQVTFTPLSYNAAIAAHQSVTFGFSAAPGGASHDATLVSVLDGHPATLSWLGAVRGHPIQPLGVDRFGQSADIDDLYRLHGIDAESIIAAARSAVRPSTRPMQS